MFRDSFRETRDHGYRDLGHGIDDYGLVQQPFMMIQRSSPLSLGNPQSDTISDPFARPTVPTVFSTSSALHFCQSRAGILQDPLGVIPASASCSTDEGGESVSPGGVFSTTTLSTPLSPSIGLKAPLATPEVQNDEESV